MKNKNQKGTFFSSKRNKYEGDYNDEDINRKGIFYFHNGDVFDGEWQADKKHGKGKL